ncbi:MAG: DUF177 domain-containing protein [Deltaproteobacteria bacterium]|nr:MAG: DUF177 domain-containing protein [Deltaproteobacteria bacterium]
MKLKLVTLAEEEQHYHWDVSEEWVGSMLTADVEADSVEAEMFGPHGPLSYDAWVHRNEDEVFFRATLTGAINAMCVRCLESFEFPLKLDFRGMFLVPEDSDFEEPGDPYCYYFDGEELDFSKPLHENVFLTLPHSPKCEMFLDTCVGESILDSEDAPVDEPEASSLDPRWAALQQIKDNLSKKD